MMREPAWVPTTDDPTPDASSPKPNSIAGTAPTVVRMAWCAPTIESGGELARRAAAANSSIATLTDPARARDASTSVRWIRNNSPIGRVITPSGR